MIVIVLTSAPAKLSGDLTRWLAEVGPGVFAGTVSRRVKDHLWRRVQRQLGRGSAILVFADPSREQGYGMLTAGPGRWVPADFDGLTLVIRPN